MPELPEVETIKRGLEKLVVGKQVEALDVINPKSFQSSEADKRFLLQRKIESVQRRGKVLFLNLDSDYTLLVHLKMTGQLVFDSTKTHFGAGHPSPSLINRLPDKSTRVTIRFSDGSQLYFNDQRKFGWMRLYPSAQIKELPFFSKLGPEPLDSGFNSALLQARLSRHSRSPIKAALLHQSAVAGVGNIYADESLWGAKIHPATLVSKLSAADYERLTIELVKILKISIQKGGSTDRNYVDAEGKRGRYLDFARVFRRQGQPCPRCSSTIIKIRVAGRGTHICPHCQKIKA